MSRLGRDTKKTGQHFCCHVFYFTLSKGFDKFEQNQVQKIGHRYDKAVSIRNNFAVDADAYGKCCSVYDNNVS